MIGSAPIYSRHEVRPFGRGPTALFRGLYSPRSMVINHLLLNGMILQVGVVHKALCFLDVVSSFLDVCCFAHDLGGLGV